MSDISIADKLTKFNDAMTNKYTLYGYGLKKSMDEIIPELSKDYTSKIDYYGPISKGTDEENNTVWIANILEIIALIIIIIIIIIIATQGHKIKVK